MKNEIERKFFVREMPDVSAVKPIRYERYFLERTESREVRTSKVDDSYIYEEKEAISPLERTRSRREITREEFETLKEGKDEAIIRDRYDISLSPKISVQVYHGRFEGLIRAEVEFESVAAAHTFTPLPWMGREMTNLPIARDATLLDLTKEQFASYVS